MSHFVYHASKKQNLKILKPNVSTHKNLWLYATKDMETSSLFLGDNSDFICQVGLENGKPYVVERFKGALAHAYKNKSGSIYKIKGDKFKTDKTSWSAELVSEEEVKPVNESKVKDALKFILNLKKEGKVKIYNYPNLPIGYPTDKSDLIEKAVSWTNDFGSKILDEIKKYHPDILPEVHRRLDK